MNKGKNRSYLFGVVGAYLLYLAYQLYQGMNDPEGGMSPGLQIFFIVFFVLAGIALLVYAVRLWIHSTKEKEEEEKPPEKQDELKG